MKTLIDSFKGKYKQVELYYYEEKKVYMVYYDLKGWENVSKENAIKRFEECKKECIRFDEIMDGNY